MHTPEQAEYANNWKRETAAPGGLAHTAHKHNHLFDEEGEGAEQLRQETAKPAGAGLAPTEVQDEAPTQETTTGCGAPEVGARKPDNLFVCDREEEEPPDRGAEDAAAVQTESAQQTSDPRKSLEEMTGTTIANSLRRCRTL